MFLNRSENLQDELLNFKVIHGLSPSHLKDNLNYNYIPVISKDIKVVMISNNEFQNPNLTDYINSEKMDFTFIKLDLFRCWIDKILPLLELCKSIENKYIMYLDTTDTILVSDLLNPEEILNTYNCKILFNAEDNYSYPGHPCDPKEWLKNYNSYYDSLEKVRQTNIKNLSNKINTNGFYKSLNAGVFLGERIFLIEVLSLIYDLMLDDRTKGYPHGESDDQLLWQFLMATYKHSEIEIDYYNLYFLWIHARKLHFSPDHWEHFNYFNKIN